MVTRHRFVLFGLGTLGLGAVLACTGCSSTEGSANAPGAAPDGTSATEPAADAGGADAGSDGASSGIPAPTACPAAKHATLVVVGDSISDTGGRDSANEQPFYRTLLVRNDDAKYPDWKGFDLGACWGLDPTANVVKVSQGGAVATVPASNDPKDMGILLNQVKSLPESLTGPVLVVGTIGGNDVRAGLVAEITGTPAAQKAKVDGFVAGFGAAMAELTRAGRFGAGVKVDVLMANIYDPTGGSGNFQYAPKNKACPGGLDLWPQDRETRPALSKWNDALTAEAAKYPGLALVDIRTPFEPHAVATPAGTNWYSADCIHPNATGQAAIRAVFWGGIVGLRFVR